ncbi:MAG: glycerophosphodiester phosphodiesterase family protein [Armatimonadota bacterium]
MPNMTKRFLVSCHRGCTERSPENTVAAARDAVRLGADLIECDVRTTADGHLVIMHDSTVDRTTDGVGPIAGMTLAQVRRLRMRDTRFADIGSHRVPTLTELVDAVGGRAGFYIDTKDVHPAALKRVIRDPKVIAKSIAYISTDEASLWKQHIPELRLMATAPDDVRTPKQLRDFVTMFQLSALDGPLTLTKEQVAAAFDMGVLFMPDTLTLSEGPEIWSDVIARGAGGIQTDRPSVLIDFLKQRRISR